MLGTDRGLLGAAAVGMSQDDAVAVAAAVLLVASAAGALVLALVPRSRGRCGVPLLVLLAVAVSAVPFATSEGRTWQGVLGGPGGAGVQLRLGAQLVWVAVPLLLGVTAMLVVDARVRDGAVGTRGRRVLPVAVATSVLLAVVVTVQVVQVGDPDAHTTGPVGPSATVRSAHAVR